MRKKILIIAMGNSVHTVRWIKNIEDLNCDIYLFSSFTIPFVSNKGCYSPKIKLFNFRPEGEKYLKCALKNPIISLSLLKTFNLTTVKTGLHRFVVEDERKMLTKVLNKNKFDIIHTLHTQTSAFLLQEALKYTTNLSKFKWIHTVWGSDLYLYQWFEESRHMLKNLLPQIDYYWGEGTRDYNLAIQLGFRGKFLSPVPAFGGVDIEFIRGLEYKVPSQRKYIIVKGYQNVVGRADIIFHALEMCADVLNNYEIIIMSYENEIIPTVGKLFSAKYNVRVTCISDVSYDDVIKMHLQSRVFIALSVSDGLPASFIEAMSCGEFPIQSNTSMASEWVEDGKSAFLVNPGNTNEVAKAIRKALTDDEFVDSAGVINREIIFQKLSKDSVGNKIRNTYSEILNDN